MEHRCVITPLHRLLRLTCVTAPENVTNYLPHPAHYFPNKRVSAYTSHPHGAPLAPACSRITPMAAVLFLKVMLFDFPVETRRNPGWLSPGAAL